MQMDFEVVGGQIAERRMPPLSVIMGDMVADFELGLDQSRGAAAVEQFGFEAASKRFGGGVVVAVAASAHALQRAVFCDQVFEAGGRVLAALVGVDDEPGRGPAHR